jgi:hypothetical protein
MAIPLSSILTVLSHLAPLAKTVATNLQSPGTPTKGDERILNMERELLRMSKVLAGVTEQLQAVVQALRTRERRVNTSLILSVVALCTAAATLGFAAFG